MKTWMIAGVACLALSACQTPAERDVATRGLCGQGQSGRWTSLSPPADANALRAFGGANSSFSRDTVGSQDPFPHEYWFGGDDGTVMLCVADAKLKNACSGEWWTFERGSGGPKIKAQSAWICVT